MGKRGALEEQTTRVAALVKASEAAVKGDEKAGDMLKKAANCKACHSKFRAPH